MVKGVGLKEDMPDIVQVERKHSRPDFKTLTTRRFQEFNEDLSKVGREAFGFLSHYGTLAPLLSRSDHGRSVKMFFETFASDLLRLGWQACEFMRFYATLATSGIVIQKPQENVFKVGQKFVSDFIWELSGLLTQSVRFILHFTTLRFIRIDGEETVERGVIKTLEVASVTHMEGSSKYSASSADKSTKEVDSRSPNTPALSRHPSHFTSSNISMKTSLGEEPLSPLPSTSPMNDSGESSQPGFSKDPEIPSPRMSSTEGPRDRGGLVSGLTSFSTATKNFVAGFLHDVYKLHKYGGHFLVSFLPTRKQLKTSALFQIIFAKDVSALFVYVFRFTVYYLFYPYPLRLLKAFQTWGGLRVASDALALIIKAVMGIFSLGRTIFRILFIAREDEEVVDSNEPDEKAETAKSEHEKDLTDIKIDPEDLKGIEFKPGKPAIKKLQLPRKEAPNSEPKLAKRVKIPPVGKTIDIEGDEFEHEMLEIAKSSEVNSRLKPSDQDMGTRMDYSTEEDDSAYNSVRAAQKKKMWEGYDEEVQKRRMKETRDGESQTAMSEPEPPPPPPPPQLPRRKEKSFTDAGTDPAPPPPPQYVTELDLMSGRRNKSRHSSGAAGFYSSDELSECSDLMPDTECFGVHEQSPQPQQRRPASWAESAAARRSEAAPAPIARSSSSVSVSRGPEGRSTLELSIPLNVSAVGASEGRDAFSTAIHEATQAFERSLVEAAENFSHNLAALRGYEGTEQSAAAAGEGGLKRSLSEHYLPAVAVPDFAEAAFDAIRRAQRMRQVEEMSEQRARHLESVGGGGGGAEKGGRRRTFETRKIEVGDLPSAYRPSIGFRARSSSVGGDVLHSSLLVQESRYRDAQKGFFKKCVNLASALASSARFTPEVIKKR